MPSMGKIFPRSSWGSHKVRQKPRSEQPSTTGAAAGQQRELHRKKQGETPTTKQQPVETRAGREGQAEKTRLGKEAAEMEWVGGAVFIVVAGGGKPSYNSTPRRQESP